MTKLYLLCGIPFSGKSTFAKKFSEIKNIPIIDFDEIKFEIFGQNIKDENLVRKDWNKVYQKTFQRIEELLKQGKSVIYDMGNFTKEERTKVRKITDKLKIETITIYINTPYRIAKKRFLENKKSKIRFDITEEDFEKACKEIEIPKTNENVLFFNYDDHYKAWIRKCSRISFKKSNPFSVKYNMDIDYVLKFINKMKDTGIDIWLDGGWGVDALLEKQTRPHEDLDIVIQKKDLPLLKEILRNKGFINFPRPDTRSWNFIMGDKKGHLIDIHVINFDKKGDGLYGPKKKGIMFPAKSLTGKGKINKTNIKCIFTEYVIKFHCQYEPDNDDFQDISAICNKFKIKLPKEYLKFNKQKTSL